MKEGGKKESLLTFTHLLCDENIINQKKLFINRERENINLATKVIKFLKMFYIKT